MTIERFVSEIAQVSRQSVFPVLALGGSPTGAVTLDLLARTRRGRYGDRVQSVVVALPVPYLATPDDRWPRCCSDRLWPGSSPRWS